MAQQRRIPIPYRCPEDRHERLMALSDMTGLSCQRMIDDMVEELLWKFQTESPYFKDLSFHKQSSYVVADVITKAPAYKRFFNWGHNERQDKGTQVHN